jgi:pimeloyl-ACP methyl ester carboxylesterase
VTAADRRDSPLPRPTTFAFVGDDGARLVGDRLPGVAPGYLFLHGFASVRAGAKSDTLFDHARRAGRAAVRIDCRGHGDSDGVLGEAPLGRVVRDVVGLLEQVGPSRIVGASFGGVVAAVVAARRPELVAGLALVAPAFGLLPALQRMLDEQGRMRTVDGRMVRIGAAALAEASAFDESAVAAALQVPVLVAHGDADEIVPMAAVERFFAGIASPRRELWRVAGGDHRLATVAAELWPRFDRLLDG